jgi:hypothetical protein
MESLTHKPRVMRISSTLIGGDVLLRTRLSIQLVRSNGLLGVLFATEPASCRQRPAPVESVVESTLLLETIGCGLRPTSGPTLGSWFVATETGNQKAPACRRFVESAPLETSGLLVVAPDVEPDNRFDRL